MNRDEIVTLTREDHTRILEMLLCERPPIGVLPPPDQEPTAISKLLIDTDAI
ncbi:MAG: hypothetical protein HYU64_13110 [Armatimonadetes bacterium]|nr:hypothetical protein [Armatimonadota bacterium]